VWEATPVTQVVQQQQQPTGGQPATGQQGVETAPMPSTNPNTPSVQAAPSNQQPVVVQQNGRRGRRAARRNNGYYSAPVTMATSQEQQGTTRQSFYQGPGNGQGALIDVRVPVANAQITFDGAPTNQQGLNRVYSTPALNPQATNTYEVRARWTAQDGNQIEQTRTVRAIPGQRILVDFTTQQQ
jgi:uncharacterized protein (TIGR03000 family)